MSLPLVQVAIDTTSVERAIPLIRAAIDGGADWIELGKPLVEFEGLNGLRRLQTLLEGHYVLVDVMIIAAPEKYIVAARELGARNVTVSALAPHDTVVAAIEAGKRHGIDVTVDLFNVADVVGTARTYSELDADYLMVHFGVDQKRNRPDGSPIETLRQVIEAVHVPVSYATYDLDESRRAVEAGASVIVQGEPLLSVEQPRAALAEFISSTRSFGSTRPLEKAPQQ